MPNVTHIKSDLKKLLPEYTLISDAIAGETAIKRAKTKYLPMPNASDTSEENLERYAAYITRAVFYNVARRTLNALVGQVFMRPSVVNVPPLLASVITDTNGEGVTLEQLTKKATRFALAYSRGGLFVDYPTTEQAGGVSLAQLQAGAIRPTLHTYAATQIINWRTVQQGANNVLSLVCIYELYCVHDDGFETETAGQIRVLKLDEQGFYVQEIYRDANNAKTDLSKMPRGNFELWQSFFPLDNAGNRMREIPFRFFGSDNNDTEPDQPQFYDLCSLNVAHYRNSADYEESAFIVGQPTPVFTGLTEDWVNDVLKGTVNFGSRGGIPLPAGSSAALLQAQANGVAKEAMEMKERQMVALGAKLVEQKQVQRTATEAELESASQGSVLLSAVMNVEAVFNWGLKFAASWIGANPNEVDYKLNKDFDIARVSPEERNATMAEWQSGALTFSEMRTVLKRAGSATLDDSEALNAIRSEMVDTFGATGGE